MLAELNCVDERVEQLLSDKLPDARSVTEALYLALIDGLSSMKPAASAKVCAPGSAAAHHGGASSPPSVSSTNRLEQVTNRLEQVTRHALKRGAEVNSRWTLPHVGADKKVVHFPLLAFAVFSRNVQRVGMPTAVRIRRGRECHARCQAAACAKRQVCG
jgi:hypothetical protein